MRNYHLHHAKELVDALERVVREDGVEQIVLAGDEVIMPVLRDQLPQHLTGRMVRLARTTGAHISFIEDPALLADVGGVGAMLRYRL